MLWRPYRVKGVASEAAQGPFTLAADFFGGSLLPCNLLVLFARPAPHALDLAKVPVEKRDDEWEREPEIEARTEVRGSVENDITIDERRQ